MAEENDKLEQLRKAFGDRFYKKIRSGEKPTLDDLLLARSIDSGNLKHFFAGTGGKPFASADGVEVSTEMAMHMMGSSKFDVAGRPTGDFTMIPLLPLVKRSGQETTPLMLGSRGSSPKIFVRTGKLIPEREGMEPYVFTEKFLNDVAGQRSLDQSVYLPFAKRNPFRHGEIESTKPQIIVDSEGRVRLTSSQRIYPNSPDVKNLTYEVTGYRVGNKRYTPEEMVRLSKQGFHENVEGREFWHEGIRDKPEPIVKLRLESEQGLVFEEEYDIGKLEAEERRIIKQLSDVKAGDVALNQSDQAVRRMAAQYADQAYGGQIATEITRNIKESGRKLTDFTINDSDVFFDIESVSRPTKGDFYITQLGVAKGASDPYSVLPTYMFNTEAAREALEYTPGGKLQEAGKVARRMINVINRKNPRLQKGEQIAGSVADMRAALGLTGEGKPRFIGYNISRDGGFDIPALIEKGVLTKQEADELEVVDLFKTIQQNRRAVEQVYGIDLSEGLSLENVYKQMYRRFEGKEAMAGQSHNAAFDVEMTRYVYKRLQPFMEAKRKLNTPTSRVQMLTRNRLESIFSGAIKDRNLSPMGNQYSFDPMGRLVYSTRLSKTRMERRGGLGLFHEGTYDYTKGNIRGKFNIAGKDAMLTIENTEYAGEFKPYYSRASQLDNMLKDFTPEKISTRAAGEVGQIFEAVNTDRLLESIAGAADEDIYSVIGGKIPSGTVGISGNPKFVGQAYAFMGEMAQRTGLASKENIAKSINLSAGYYGKYGNQVGEVFASMELGKMYADQLGGRQMVELLSSAFGVQAGARVTLEDLRSITTAGGINIYADKNWYFRQASESVKRPISIAEMIDAMKDARKPRDMVLKDIMQSISTMFQSSNVNITPSEIRKSLGVGLTDFTDQVSNIRRSFEDFTKEIFTTYQRGIADMAENIGDLQYSLLKQGNIPQDVISKYAQLLSDEVRQTGKIDVEGAVRKITASANLSNEQIDVLRRLSDQVINVPYVTEHFGMVGTSIRTMPEDVIDELTNILDVEGLEGIRDVKAGVLAQELADISENRLNQDQLEILEKGINRIAGDDNFIYNAMDAAEGATDYESLYRPTIIPARGIGSSVAGVPQKYRYTETTLSEAVYEPIKRRHIQELIPGTSSLLRSRADYSTTAFEPISPEHLLNPSEKIRRSIESGSIDTRDVLKHRILQVMGSEIEEFQSGTREELAALTRVNNLTKTIYSDSYIPPSKRLIKMGKQAFSERMSKYIGTSVDMGKTYKDYTKLYNRFLWAELNLTYNSPGGRNISGSFDEFITNLDTDYEVLATHASKRASQNAFMVLNGMEEAGGLLERSGDRAFMEVSMLNKLMEYRRQFTNQSEAVAGFGVSLTENTVTVAGKTYDVTGLMEESNDFVKLMRRANKIQGIRNTPIAQMATNIGIAVEIAKRPDLVTIGDKTLQEVSGDLRLGNLRLNDLLSGKVENLDIGSFIKLSSYSPEILASVYGVKTTSAMMQKQDIENMVFFSTMDTQDLGDNATPEDLENYYRMQALISDEVADAYQAEGADIPDSQIVRAMMGLNEGGEVPPEVMYTLTEGMEVTRGGRRYSVESWINTNVLLRDIETDELTAVSVGSQKIKFSERSFSALFSNVYAEAQPNAADAKAQQALVDTFYKNFSEDLTFETPDEMIEKAPKILDDYRAFTRVLHGYMNNTKQYSSSSLMNYVDKLQRRIKSGNYSEDTINTYRRILSIMSQEEVSRNIVDNLGTLSDESVEKAISDFGYMYGTDPKIDRLSLNFGTRQTTEQAFSDHETRKLAEKMGIDTSKQGKETTQQSMKKMDYNFWKKASRYAPVAVGMFGFFGLMGAMSSVQAKQEAEQAKQQQVMNTISLTPSLAKQMRYQPSQPEVSAAINAENTSKQQLSAYTQALGMSNAYVRHG